MAQLQVESTYNRPIETVFAAWTEPEVMRRWWHAGDSRWQNTVAEVDLRVGGRLRTVMRSHDDIDYGASGEYTDLQPPRRLAFTLTWDLRPENTSLVEVDFRSESAGATTVTVTHSGLPGENSKAGHTEGWNETLANLALALEA